MKGSMSCAADLGLSSSPRSLSADPPVSLGLGSASGGEKLTPSLSSMILLNGYCNNDTPFAENFKACEWNPLFQVQESAL